MSINSDNFEYQTPGSIAASCSDMDAIDAPAGRGAAVCLRELTHAYGALEVLRAVDLEVAPGEFLAIVGRSGCGKSTLLRLLAGLDEPSSGSVRLEATGVRRASDDVRLMFQDARLLPWKSVLDNVALGGLRGRGWRRMQALRVLQHVGLGDRARHWPSTLSGGQRQRVALARALLDRPRLLLLDEPFGALDALTRIEMHALLESIWRDSGFTAVLVTHDVAEAVALADRVLLIEDGQIVIDQRVALPRPRDRTSRRFALLEETILQRILRKWPAPSRTDHPQEAIASGYLAA